VNIILNSYCNLECNYCFADEYMEETWNAITSWAANPPCAPAPIQMAEPVNSVDRSAPNSLLMMIRWCPCWV